MRQNYPQIIGGYDNDLAHLYNNQDLVNMYVDIDPNSPRPMQLIHLPGTDVFKTVTAAGDRTGRINGIYAYQDFIYFAMDEIVYQMNKGGLIVQLGPATLVTDAGPLSWANNTTQIAIADGSNLYVFDIPTNTFVIVTLEEGIPVSPFACYYQDARLFVRFINDPRIYFSAQGDFRLFSAENFEVQLSRPSVARGIIGTNDRLFVIGDVSTEIWQPPTYASNDPIIRDNNLLYEFGCAAIASIIKGIYQESQTDPINSFVSWLTTDPNGSGCFIMCMGGPPYKISTLTIDRDLEGFEDLSDFYGVLYKINANVIIEWTSIKNNVTYVYSMNTKSFSRKFNFNLECSNISGHAFSNNKHYIIYRNTNKIYTLNERSILDDGLPIRCSRVTPTLFDENGKQLTVQHLIIYFETGNVAQGENPISYLQVSNDFGKTYSTPYPEPIGKIGEFTNQARFFNLGTDYNFTFKIEVNTAVKILGASINYAVKS